MRFIMASCTGCMNSKHSISLTSSLPVSVHALYLPSGGLWHSSYGTALILYSDASLSLNTCTFVIPMLFISAIYTYHLPLCLMGTIFTNFSPFLLICTWNTYTGRRATEQGGQIRGVFKVSVTLRIPALNHKCSLYWCWRDGLAIKSTGNSSKRLEFNSQKPHNCNFSHRESDTLFWPQQAHGVQTCMPVKHPYTQNKNKTTKT